MTEREIADWEREIKHAEKMQEQRKSKEQNIKDDIKARNARTRLDEHLRKERVNSEFWNRVRQVLTIIAIAIVAYTLIHFAWV